jgi:hypothetical protein
MMITIAQADTSDPATLARLIHDDVLQSLGVAVLGVDLCRRLHQKMRYEQALAELVGIVEALGQALASSEELQPGLERLVPPSKRGSVRPSLVMLASTAAAGGARMTTVGPSSSEPREIVDTLSACLIQARRCRGQYDAGLGEETMRDLELMLQRLEFVSVAFRQVMGSLRQLTAETLVPLPSLSRPVAVARVRSA